MPQMTTTPKGRGQNAHNKSKTELSKTVSMTLVQEVFDYWKEVMGKKRAVMDTKRARDIGWAIAVYGLDGARDAIDGCKASPFHMGQNNRKTAYNDITLIFRDAEHVERFHDELDKTKSSSAKQKWLDS
jgi:hypothetical protein